MRTNRHGFYEITDQWHPSSKFGTLREGCYSEDNLKTQKKLEPNKEGTNFFVSKKNKINSDMKHGEKDAAGNSARDPRSGSEPK